MENNLVVSEKFYSLQGEGQTMGVPAVFLRLAGCNILCQGKGWVCDSIEVWRKGEKQEFKAVLFDFLHRLSVGAHLVITGGEPLLHQKKLVSFLKWFENEYKWLPIIEVETNGTIMPDNFLLEKVKYWNCSPKLESSGETKLRRFKPEVLKKLNKVEGTIFKFVISSTKDIDEIRTDFTMCSEYRIVLMPSGDSQDKLKKIRTSVMNSCVDLGWRYSDRLHIVGWNQKTGV